MAERRMFSKAVFDSDKFMSLPFSAQAFYTHLAMRADDDGFVGNAKSILRMVGAKEEDFNLLAEQGYLRVFDSSVVAIVHWKVHNYIQKDRYKPSIYKEERALMYPEFTDKSEEKTKENYEENLSVSNLDTQDRLGKDSIGKDRLGKDSIGKDRTDKDNKEKVNTHKSSADKPKESTAEERTFLGVSENECEKIIDLYNSLCTSLTKVQGATADRKHNVALLLKKYTPQQIEEVFRKAQECPFLCGKGERGWKASFDWLIREDNFLRVYEGAYNANKSLGEEDCSFDIDEYERKTAHWLDNMQF